MLYFYIRLNYVVRYDNTLYCIALYNIILSYLILSDLVLYRITLYCIPLCYVILSHITSSDVHALPERSCLRWSFFSECHDTVAHQAQIAGSPSARKHATESARNRNRAFAIKISRYLTIIIGHRL